MTNNEKFKADTEELLTKITTYKKRYSFMSGGRMNQKGVDILVDELKVLLTVLRTDEENADQQRRDSYC